MKTLFVTTFTGKTFDYQIDETNEKVAAIKKLLNKDQPTLKVKRIDLYLNGTLVQDSQSVLDLMKEADSLQLHLIYNDKKKPCVIF